MKEVRLTRTDSSSDEISVSLGEVVIGRGALLQCRDPRVSRNHGLLKFTENEELTLIPTHSNPCFYRKMKDKTVNILRKGNNIILQTNDEFGLVPDKFWFRVEILPGKSAANSVIENSSVNVDNEEESKNSETNDTTIEADDIESEETATQKIEDEDNENVNVKQGITESSSTNDSIAEATQNNKSPRKHRILPAWMATSSSNSTTPVAQKKRTPKKNTETSPTPKRRSPQKNANTASSSKQSEDEDDDVSNSGAHVAPSRTHALSDDDEEEDNNKIPNKDFSASKGNTTINGAVITDPSTSNSVVVNAAATTNTVTTKPATSSNSTGAVRSLCIYGRNCYRKNADHKREFCHPKDADYVSIYKSLPVCPYGKDCYRKNREHRSSYRHDSKPTGQGNTSTKKPTRKPKQKNRTTARRQYTDESSEDDYDYDDPFLYDGSSDDYQPTDSDVSTDSDWISDGDSEPDLKRMKKEGKKFVKGK